MNHEAHNILKMHMDSLKHRIEQLTTELLHAKMLEQQLFTDADNMEAAFTVDCVKGEWDDID